MSNVTLNPGHRYTFAKVDTVPVIIDSTDHAEGKSYFRNNVEITGSLTSIPALKIQNTGDELLTLTNRENSIGADVELTFSSSYDGYPGAVWTIGVDARSNSTPFSYNNFTINNGANFGGTPGLFISASNVIVIDYSSLPASATGLPQGAIYRDASNFLKVVP